MTVCSTTSSYVFSTRINLAKSSKISSWNRGSSCKVRRARGRGGRQGLEAEGPRFHPARALVGLAPAPRTRRGLWRGTEGGPGLLTDLQVGASFLSRKGMVICSSASRKKRFRTELLS